MSVVAMAALDDSGNLTDPLGLRIAEFPLNPMFARMLLQSGLVHNLPAHEYSNMRP